MNNYLIDGETGRVITEDVRIFVTGAQLEAYEKYKKAKSRRKRFQRKREFTDLIQSLCGLDISPWRS